MASYKFTSYHFISPTHTELLLPDGSNQSPRANSHWLRASQMPMSSPITGTVIGQTWVMSLPLKSGRVKPIERVDSERREDGSPNRNCDAPTEAAEDPWRVKTADFHLWEETVMASLTCVSREGLGTPGKERKGLPTWQIFPLH